MNDLTRSIQDVREKMAQACLRVGRKPEEILLVAVSKTVPIKRIQLAFREGLSYFGENYIQEAQVKIEALGQGSWHFIGHLQRNKAKYAVRLFSMIETVDNSGLAEELNRLALRSERTLDFLIQVNEAGEETKSGLSPSQVPALLAEIPRWQALRFQGLMTMPPYDPDPEKSRPWYRSLFRWREKWQAQFPELNFLHLSMGMSHDFEVAIEEGATIIRVGTALFGAR